MGPNLSNEILGVFLGFFGVGFFVVVVVFLRRYFNGMKPLVRDLEER